MSDTTLIAVPFGDRVLAMTAEQFHAAIERGRALIPQQSAPLTSPDDRVVDAEQAAAETGIPVSWFLEQARQNRIPHLRFGRYVRFRFREIVEAVSVQRRQPVR